MRKVRCDFKWHRTTFETVTIRNGRFLLLSTTHQYHPSHHHHYNYHRLYHDDHRRRHMTDHPLRYPDVHFPLLGRLLAGINYSTIHLKWMHSWINPSGFFRCWFRPDVRFVVSSCFLDENRQICWLTYGKYTNTVWCIPRTSDQSDTREVFGSPWQEDCRMLWTKSRYDLIPWRNPFISSTKNLSVTKLVQSGVLFLLFSPVDPASIVHWALHWMWPLRVYLVSIGMHSIGSELATLSSTHCAAKNGTR